MNRQAAFLFIGLFFIASCSDKPLNTITPDPEPSKSELRDIPFASATELAQWNQDPNIADYRVARVLALMELNYSTNELSEYPVIIYDFDSTPRYYEFILIDGTGAPKGTICTYARKEQAGIVAYILPQIRNYTSVPTKSLGVKTFARFYPTDLQYGIPTRSGSSPVALINAQGAFEAEIPPAQHSLDLIEQIDKLGPEYFQNMGIDNLEEQKTAIAERITEEQSAARIYWEQISLIEPDLIAQNEAGWIKTKSAVTTIDEFVLAQYDTEAMQKTRWSGGCGPSALANMYRGLYDHYKDVYLPLWEDENFVVEGVESRIIENDRAVYYYKDKDNDEDGDGKVNLVDRDWIESRSALADNGLYADICDYNWYYFASRIPFAPDWGAAFPCNLTHSLQRITNGAYTLSILPTLAPHRHIRNEELSVLLLSSDFSHFLHAYGTREQSWQWKSVFKLFGKEFTLALPEIVTHRWFKVNDSGTEMVKHDMLPFWIDDNVLHSIFKFEVHRCK